MFIEMDNVLINLDHVSEIRVDFRKSASGMIEKALFIKTVDNVLPLIFGKKRTDEIYNELKEYIQPVYIKD